MNVLTEHPSKLYCFVDTRCCGMGSDFVVFYGLFVTLNELNLSIKRHKVHMLIQSFLHTGMAALVTIIRLGRQWPLLHNQSHTCWLPSDARGQAIGSNGIDPVLSEQFSRSTRGVNASKAICLINRHSSMFASFYYEFIYSSMAVPVINWPMFLSVASLAVGQLFHCPTSSEITMVQFFE